MGVLFQVFIAEVATFVCVSDIPNLDFDLARIYTNFLGIYIHILEFSSPKKY